MMRYTEQPHISGDIYTRSNTSGPPSYNWYDDPAWHHQGGSQALRIWEDGAPSMTLSPDIQPRSGCDHSGKHDFSIQFDYSYIATLRHIEAEKGGLA